MTRATPVVNKRNARRAGEMGQTHPDICFTTQLDVLSMISHRDCIIRRHITAHMRAFPHGSGPPRHAAATQSGVRDESQEGADNGWAST
jgi:hypothetical protein